MRIRKLAPVGLIVGVAALVFSFAPANAAIEITGSIEMGHPGTQSGVGYEYLSHPCEEIKNEDGTGNYDGFDAVWIDIRDKAGAGTPIVVSMDPALDIDVYFYALADEDGDGEFECNDMGGDAVAGGFLGEAGKGEVPANAAFVLVDGWAGHGAFTIKLG